MMWVTSLWTALTSRIAGYIAAVGVAASILFAAYAKGKNDAAANATSDRLAAANKARKIENEVDGLGAAGIDERLSKWMRDGAKGQ